MKVAEIISLLVLVVSLYLGFKATRAIRRRLLGVASLILVALDWHTLRVVGTFTQILLATLWVNYLPGVVTLILKVVLLC